MATVATLTGDLRLETAAFRNDLDKATRALRASTSRMKREADSVSRSFAGIQGAVGAVGAGLRGLGAGLAIGGVIAIAQQAGRTADAYNNLQARIKLATKATGDYQKVNNELLATSKLTGASLETSVDVFQRLQIGAKALGRSNDDVLKLVKAVEQLGVSSGASTTAMNAGLLQFGQAMSSEVMRAEEFNSIVENLPALAQRIADGFGVTLGELRQMVLDGRVLSKDVFSVILSQTEDINSQFQDMPNTIERAGSRMNTSFSNLVGTLDQALGVTNKIADAMNFISDAIDKNIEAQDRMAEFDQKFAKSAIRTKDAIGYDRNKNQYIYKRGTEPGAMPKIDLPFQDRLGSVSKFLDDVINKNKYKAKLAPAKEKKSAKEDLYDARLLLFKLPWV